MNRTAWIAGLCLVGTLGALGCSADAQAPDGEESSGESELVQSEVVGTWRFARGAGPLTLSGLSLNADGTYVGELLKFCAQGPSSIEDAGCAPRVIDGTPPAGSGLGRGTWKLVRKSSWCGAGSTCADFTGNNFIELEGAFYRYEQPGNRAVPLRLVLAVSQPLLRNGEMKLKLASAYQAEFVYGGSFPQIDVSLKRTAVGDMFCAESEHCKDMVYAMIACPAGLQHKPLCNAKRTCEASCVEPARAGYGDACNTRADHGAIKPCASGMSCRETNIAGDADVCRTP